MDLVAKRLFGSILGLVRELICPVLAGFIGEHPAEFSNEAKLVMIAFAPDTDPVMQAHAEFHQRRQWPFTLPGNQARHLMTARRDHANECDEHLAGQKS
jgi:hypothetical protein